MPDDAIARSRQIIADHCFGPHDTKAAYERALEIAAACTDDMFDEGLLAAGHASPAAPADDEATVIDCMAKASWDAADGFVTATPWPPNNAYRVEKERRRARAVIAAWTGQQWYIGQEIEWNPTGDEWKTGFIAALSLSHASIVLHENAQYMTVSTGHIRARAALAALREGQQK